jgi:hypothetical protein
MEDVDVVAGEDPGEDSAGCSSSEEEEDSHE